MWLVVVVQIAVPLLLIAVIAITRQPSRLRWLGIVVAFGMVTSYLLVSARWDVSSLYLRAVIPLLFIAAGIVGYRRIRAPETPPGFLQAAVAWTISLGLIVLMSGFLWFSLRGYRTPEGAVDLASPLRGTHVVLNGGVSPFTNGHFRVHPQDYALDILGVNALGARASLFGSSRDLESYVIYGEPIFSPCSGKISVTADGLPDHIPPSRDTENLAGNHVLIECEGFEVLVAHLHIHAERGGEPGVILDGEAVPITIDGRFLVRNSVFRSRG